MSCPDVIRVALPGAPAVVKVTVPDAPAVVRVATPGPPGPAFSGSGRLGDLVDVDVGGKVNNSLLFYSAGNDKFTANNTTTILTLTDGGNF